MKKRLLLPLLLAGMWATPAMAAPYVSVSAGLGLLNDSDVSTSGGTVNNLIGYKAGVPVGVAVGVKSDEFRLEGAVGYQSHNIDTVAGVAQNTNFDVSIWSFMANGYYDISAGSSSITPYLTAGLGFDAVNGSGDGGGSFDSTVFAWQVGAGVGFKVSENTVFDLGYRYFRASDVTVADFGGGSTADISIAGSNILAGIRYSF